MLAERGSRTLIFDWDHNWDKPEEPMGVLSDPVAGNYVDAVAWHCYGGDVAAQSPVHDAFPDKDAYMTECSGGDWEPVRSGGLPLQMKNIIIRSARHWASNCASGPWPASASPPCGNNTFSSTAASDLLCAA